MLGCVDREKDQMVKDEEKQWWKGNKKGNQRDKEIRQMYKQVRGVEGKGKEYDKQESKEGQRDL